MSEPVSKSSSIGSAFLTERSAATIPRLRQRKRELPAARFVSRFATGVRHAVFSYLQLALASLDDGQN